MKQIIDLTEQDDVFANRHLINESVVYRGSSRSRVGDSLLATWVRADGYKPSIVYQGQSPRTKVCRMDKRSEEGNAAAGSDGLYAISCKARDAADGLPQVTQ